MRLNSRFLAVIAGSAVLFLTSSCGGGKETAVKVYDLGTRIEAGHLVYTVFETQWLPQIGVGDAARVPQNRFFLIRLSAVNSGSEELLVPNATLLDDNDKPSEELSDGDQIPQWIGFVRKVKPADSIAGNIAFDVQPKHYRLRLTDENGEKPAIVDIPLNFNAEAQQPIPAATDQGSGAGPGSPGKK